MFSRAWFIVRYWIAWIFFFQLARVAFLAINISSAREAGTRNFFGAMWNGLRMDMSMAAYFTIPVALLVMLSIYIRKLRNASIYTGYTAVILFIVLLLLMADVGLYQQWGIRADDSFLKYLRNPREAWASISHLPIFAIMLFFVVVYAVFVYITNRSIRKVIGVLNNDQSRPTAILICLILTSSLIIPLRGGLQLAPINQSSVYFSQNHFANLAAINPVWNFAHAIQHPTSDTKNPFSVLPESLAQQLTDSLYTKGTGQANRLGDRPNVIIIAWESFTSKVIDLKKDGIEITPGFNALKNQGIYFSNIYATGDRTDKGIVGILSGYPSQPTSSIVKVPTKAASLPMLGMYYRKAGYHTAFYYGGELEFANMKAYLLSGGFDKFTSVENFDKKDQNSKWGAHDGVVKNKLQADLKSTTQPFFYTWLTLSSHEPFETPEDAIISGSEVSSKFFNSLHYTDKVVFEFIEFCKKQPWWSNTIIAIIADHGHPLPDVGGKAKNFHIPLLLLGGAIQPAQYSRIGSQVDLAATLLAASGLDHSAFSWSRNLRDSSTINWGYFAFNNGFGFVNESGNYLFDNVGKRFIEYTGKDTHQLKLAGQAVLQQSFGDYLKR